MLDQELCSLDMTPDTRASSGFHHSHSCPPRTGSIPVQVQVTRQLELEEVVRDISGSV
jgi:hypothetical protein